MLESKIDTINVPAEMVMGKWFQMYKAAMNFDVVRTTMFCPVAYCKFIFLKSQKHVFEPVRIIN